MFVDGESRKMADTLTHTLERARTHARTHRNRRTRAPDWLNTRHMVNTVVTRIAATAVKTYAAAAVDGASRRNRVTCVVTITRTVRDASYYGDGPLRFLKSTSLFRRHTVITVVVQRRSTSRRTARSGNNNIIVL